MKDIKLSPVDKFHLRNLMDSIKYLKNSENAKQWLASKNQRLLTQLFKIEDEILENFNQIMKLKRIGINLFFTNIDYIKEKMLDELKID